MQLQVCIWELLDRRSLCTASLVCRAWHALSSTNCLWRGMCRREIRGVEWTPRMLARRHKSWKHHFGLRLRAVDPFRAALAQAVPQLLNDARTRGMTTETVEIAVALWYDTARERRFVRSVVLPHAIRHAASPRGRIGLITGAATGQPELRRQAEELGVAYYDDDHLKSFNKDKKRIKKWERGHCCFLAAHQDVIRMMPRFLGPRVGTSRQTVPLQVLRTDVPLATVVEERHRTARLRLRKSPTLQLAVGNVGMSAEQLVQNVEAFVAALREELPSWDRVSSITLHATRGPAFTLHSAKRRPAVDREEQDE